MKLTPRPRPASLIRAWSVHCSDPTDHAAIVYTLNANGAYGKSAIHETTGNPPSGLFPELLVDWGLIFQEATVQPTPPPTKDFP
ncbi:MAG: hypothetical protein IPP10_17160 [Candidatus Competibacteraceae bacterium]|nr:hypothetical protein [Candidatus Competibacteraceae bacterium]MBK9953135.1 hypothetical protein [Candidatus Competibacteraceae bacterium]